MISLDRLWKTYTSFHSTSITQQLLNKLYTSNNIHDGSRKSYDNSYAFIYYLKHGQSYYETAIHAPLSIKPMLLFYGMVQLLKACLLTVDPTYPESTSVLAHGVSTRKRKKQGYEFLDDEVKIQKNGLFTHFSEKMFHVKHLEGEKFSMDLLLRQIPEINHLFSLSNRQTALVRIGSFKDLTFNFPQQLLDTYHMTQSRFESFINKEVPFTLKPINNKNLSFTIDSPQNVHMYACFPMCIHLYEQAFYWPIHREHLLPISEIMAHYLILYNLSMICRYETEWWNEALHTHSNSDYPFIYQFLSITVEKIPFLILHYLLDRWDEQSHLD
ncbi:hypothetical protein EJF36_00070 [Bacillus sp. HMF5848]|uniref:YaaC family protein n=1 Tax=Bacillus sp. HMF5848 TaxID=2495421 RepID=UPI000F772BBE|nr:YaaC family protein [Bacillus sp. HMF5848]RSK25443.1 hypothetical protein EJF36_00070 [Bacillus sp. HMF5848]